MNMDGQRARDLLRPDGPSMPPFDGSFSNAWAEVIAATAYVAFDLPNSEERVKIARSVCVHLQYLRQFTDVLTAVASNNYATCIETMASAGLGERDKATVSCGATRSTSHPI